MPEALVNVPPLLIPTENSSEFENPSTAAEITDRSTDSRNYRREPKLPLKLQGKNKLRKSYGKRIQKKALLRAPLSGEKKVSGALKLKSHIPRAILTPSSSTTSLTTSDSSLPSPLINIDKSLRQEKLYLQHQKSEVIVAFRQRKSITEMDFNISRRPISFPIPSPTPTFFNKDGRDNNEDMRHNNHNNNINNNNHNNMLVAYPKNSFVHKMYHRDHYYPMSKQQSELAGMRIFSTIMLNAWRKRRDEVRRLTSEIADLKRGATKVKNQLHVFNSLFRVEQKRNAELSCRLKNSLADINLTKSSCESLTTSLISLKADKALLEQQLNSKEQEFESINSVLVQTKSELFKTMTLQRELQAALSQEQRNAQTIANQKNELIHEICELNIEALQKEKKLRNEIREKSEECDKLMKTLQAKELQIKAFSHTIEKQSNEHKAKEESLKGEIEGLQNDLKFFQECSKDTVGNRLKNCWHSSMPYQNIALHMLHCLAFSVLPATPPPKINALPFGLSFDKVMSIIKR